MSFVNDGTRALEPMMGTFIMLCLMEKVILTLKKGRSVKILHTPLGLTQIRVVIYFSQF